MVQEAAHARVCLSVKRVAQWNFKPSFYSPTTANHRYFLTFNTYIPLLYFT